MEDQKFSFSGSFQKAKEYIDTRLDLIKLRAIAKGSRILGAIILDFSKLLLALIVLFFFSLALGFFLGELMGSNALGFLTTGGIFLLLLVIVRFFEPKLEAKFMDISIRRVLSKWNEEDEQLSSMSQQEDELKEDDNSTEKENTDELKNQ